jgi:hypothetical protein
VATFNYSGNLPQFKADIVSSQLRLRFSDIKTFLNVLNPSGLVFPDITSAAQYQAFLLNAGKTGFTTNHVLRSNVALENDDGAGNASEAWLSDGDGTGTWSPVFRSNADFVFDGAVPSAGQLLRFDGDGTVSAVSISALTAPEVKTSNFTTAANGQFIVSTGVTTVTLHSPAGVGEQFFIMPNIGTVNFETAGVLMAGAMQVNGATLDTGYLNENVRYNFISFDGTNWWVSGEVFDV